MTLQAEWEKETRCFTTRTNKNVLRRIQAAVAEYDELLTMVTQLKLMLFGHIWKTPGLTKVQAIQSYLLFNIVFPPLFLYLFFFLSQSNWLPIFSFSCLFFFSYKWREKKKKRQIEEEVWRQYQGVTGSNIRKHNWKQDKWKELLHSHLWCHDNLTRSGDNKPMGLWQISSVGERFFLSIEQFRNIFYQHETSVNCRLLPILDKEGK